MTGLNSAVRVDLPTQASNVEEKLLDELLVVYKGVRALQAYLAEFDPLAQPITAEAVADAYLTQYYLLTGKLLFVGKAAVTITAGMLLTVVTGSPDFLTYPCFSSGGLPTQLSITGVAARAAATGEPVLIQISGSVVDLFSGLTPGVSYYTGNNGALTTNPFLDGLLRLKAATALTPTTARIHLYLEDVTNPFLIRQVFV